MRSRFATAAAVFVLAIVATASPASADVLRLTSFTPSSGPVGSAVILNGTAFSGVTSVTFNGHAATFIVNSAKRITTTVPAGATSGPITVTKPSGSVTSATDFQVSQPSLNTPWPMFQHDPQHTGKTDAIGPSGNTVHALWTYTSVSWIKNEPGIGADGTVYIGDSKFPLCALTPTNGAKNWCTNIGGYVDQSSPAIAADGTIYVGDRNNVFWAIRPDGSPIWHYTIHLDGDVRQSPIINPGPAHTVYAMCGCTTRAVLHAFTPQGTLLWRVDLPQVRDASPAAIQFGAHFRLYVITNNGDLYAVDDFGQTAQIVWHIRVGAQSSHSSPAIGGDGTIYVGTSTGLVAVHDDGTSAHVLPGWPFATAGDVDTAPAVNGHNIYVSSYAGGVRTFYAINASTNPPTELWHLAGAGSTSSSFAQTPSAVIGGNGLVYAAIGRDIYAFDGSTSTSAPRWHFRVSDDAISLTPGNGVLYVPTKNNRLFAIVSSG